MRDRLDPSEALDRIFDVIREEAAASPAFARRLLDAAGVTVVFSGPEAAISADPVLAAARGDYAAFRANFLSLPEKELRALIKSFALATEEQVKAVKGKPKRPELVDLMWDGAKRKLQDRRAG